MKKCDYIIFFVVSAFFLVIGGCTTVSEIHYSHAKHMQRGLDDCKTCHEYEKDLEPKWPKMAGCLKCHMKDFDPNDLDSCLKCHTKASTKMKVRHNIPKKYEDLKFTHKVHLENNIQCNECHAGIEKSEEITLDLIPDMFGNCIPCHKKMGGNKLECDVCHKHINKSRLPLYHADRWVAHDNTRWVELHGREFYYNKDYCKRCHTDLNWCINCHQDQKPRNHTNAWRRKTHGFAASWERKKCMVCHQEDFCIRCHDNTTPLSHSVSWGGANTRNRHCSNCHFPLSNLSCTVCHVEPTHPTASDSPHPPFLGICDQEGCHPLNTAGDAPHINPFGIACRVCHK